MRTIDNDIPEALLELAREGFALGISEVRVGFMYLDAEFVSPIEWALWLHKRKSSSNVREHLVVTMGRSSEEEQPSAYISSKTENPFEGSYWGPEEIRAWMKEPLEAEGEYVFAWSPVEDAETQEKLLAQWPLFETGVRSGWVMERSVNWSEFEIFRRTMARHGDPVGIGELPPLKIEWSIVNSFYNVEGHPDNRGTGAELSVSGWGSIGYGEEKFYEHGKSETGRPTMDALSREQVEAILSTNHPWFVRAAYNDEEQEDWLHFPEALKPAEETVDPSKL